MHIEPGIVEGAKITLSIATATACLGLVAKAALDTLKKDGFVSLIVRSVLTSLLVLVYFEVLPHYPVGVSEVHLIMGSTLFLLFGLAPAAIGLIVGLFIQSFFLAPSDLPQYGINITTLLAPLFAMSLIAKRIIPEQTAYKDIQYRHALALSTTYQLGIISWVAFWAFYGQGFGAENLSQVGSFGLAYLTVIIVEPLVDLAVLAGAKFMHRLAQSGLFVKRLYHPAV